MEELDEFNNMPDIPEADKLMQARCRLLVREPYYGHMAMSMEWVPSEMSWQPVNKRTMGVRIVHGGIVQVLFYKPYVRTRTLMQLFGEVQHIIEHLLRLHPVRRNGRDITIWGDCCDFSVNGKKSKPRIGYVDKNKRVLPYEELAFCPESLDDTLAAEQYYQMFEQGKAPPPPKKGKCKGNPGPGEAGEGEGEGQEGEGEKGQGDGEGEGEAQGQGKGKGGKGKDKEETSPDKSTMDSDYGKRCDDHECWGQSDVGEDEARQVVNDMSKQAAEKSQGHVPGHLKEVLAALEKPIVRWRELLRNYLGNHCGNKRMTYSRVNRRQPQFGVPGWSHHAACSVNVIVDTSGSISTRMLQQFFGEIEAIAFKAKIHVLQWDHAFQGYGRYRKGEWRKIKVSGRGGTDMAAPMAWLEEQKLINDCTIMLTDGQCNWSGPRPFPMITVIASNSKIDGPGWGHVVNINE